MKYPNEIQFIIRRLEQAGYEAYLVGGALRDLLLGREANDFDITTSATPVEMKAVFSDLRTLETGLRHGTLTVLVGAFSVEITTFRVDGDYVDARHPSSIRFTKSLAEDLARRDFTVNAMAYSERTGLVDLYGGREDLKQKLLRAVGDPKKRFSEDALRILRAFRFCSKLGFEIEPVTKAAIKVCREGLSWVSAERISAELEGILVGQGASVALSLMEECGVLPLVLPEAVLKEGIDRLSPRFDLRLAFLLLDDKEALGARLRAMRLSNALALSVTRLVTLASDGVCAPSEPQVRRLMARSGELFEPLLELFSAKGFDVSDVREVAARCRARGDCLSIGELAIGGDALVKLGKRGREIGETLAFLLERVLDEPSLNTEASLLALLR